MTRSAVPELVRLALEGEPGAVYVLEDALVDLRRDDLARHLRLAIEGRSLGWPLTAGEPLSPYGDMYMYGLPLPPALAATNLVKMLHEIDREYRVAKAKARRDATRPSSRRQRDDPFGALYLSETGGWTRAARIALGLTSDRYLVDERREALLPNGMAVRLLPRRPGEGRRGVGAFLRIQVRCICGCWIPVGRMGQHLPARCRTHVDCRGSQELARACLIDRHIRKYRRRCPDTDTPR